MKTFAQKIQEAAQKAIRMKQAVEGAPQKVAEFRHALQQTTHELQGIGHDVQTTISGLKLVDPSGIPEAVHHITAAAPILLEAGYVVSGFEMELGPIHRLVLCLDRAQEVPLAVVSSLVQRHSGESVTHGLLEAVLQAETVVAGLELPELTYRRLRVHLGAIPSVRLIWESTDDTGGHGAAHHSSAALPHSLTSPTQVTTPAIPSYGQSSFFERRPSAMTVNPPALPNATEDSRAEVPNAARASAPTSSSPQHGYSKDWGRGALDRFKKMPNLGSEGR